MSMRSPTVFVLAIVAAACISGAAGCALSPPPVSLSHDLPPVEAEQRNHVAVGGGVASGAESDPLAPLQASYVRRFDQLYVGISQTFGAVLALPQTRLLGAVETGRRWMPHVAVGAGWYSGQPFDFMYGTAEFGMRVHYGLGPVELYADPVLAFSVPMFEAVGSLRGYGFAMLNAGAQYEVVEGFRVSAGPMLGRARRLDGGTNFWMYSMTASASYSF